MSIFTVFIWSFILCYCTVLSTSDTGGMLDKIKNGLQYAKNYLDTAKEIADLVSKSLGQQKDKKFSDETSKGDTLSKRQDSGSLSSAFFRLLGLDSPRIAAIAVNSAIFLAQMIISLFKIQPKVENEHSESSAKNFNKFDPLEFVVNSRNEKIQDLLKQAQNADLPNQLIENLNGFDSSCVRLLMCKASPFIWAAQSSLKNKTSNRRFDLTSWLPTKQAFEENDDVCEEKHVDCQVFPELE